MCYYSLSINEKLKVPFINNVYIVEKGDTLYSIAKRFNITVNELKRINNLESNVLSIGQQLLI